MNTILQINSSLAGDDSQSSRLAAEFAQRLARSAGRALVVRDVGRNPVPHLTAERLAAIATPASERTLEQQRVVSESDALVEELRQAATVVLAVPMYNFGIPSPLKAWFDHVARAGVTFRYSAEGPVGLLAGRNACVFVTSGGKHVGTPRDLLTPYLRQILGFVGIGDVEFVHAEGLALGAEQREAALRSANRHIERLAA